jgi:hypothetical protein
MIDENENATAETDAMDAPSDGRDDGPADDETDDGPRLRRFLNYGLLAGLLLVALVSAIGLYTAISSAISTWVAREWRPLFRAAFNLAVLLLAGSGIVWQIRRMR